MTDWNFVSGISKGQFGEVNLYANKINGTLAAVKRIIKQKDDTEESILESHKKEVAILTKLKGSKYENYILQIIEDWPEKYSIVTEYIHYVDLYTYIKNAHSHLMTRKEWARSDEDGTYDQYLLTRPRLIDKVFFKIVENLINGLMLIHEENVAHRDIKPDNIMIDPESLDIKYIDFGLSTMKEDNSWGSGTSYYMAPEVVIKGELNLIQCQKSDIWSLAHTIWFLRYGKDRIKIWKNLRMKEGDEKVKALIDNEGIEDLYCVNHLHPELLKRDKECFFKPSGKEKIVLTTRQGMIIPSLSLMMTQAWEKREYGYYDI